MEINQIVWDIVDSNSWLITDEKQGLLIDVVDNQELYRAIQQIEHLTIILTHCHFDHIIGLNRIRELRPDVNVIATELCSENIGNIYKNMSASASAFLFFYRGRNDVEIDTFTCASTDIKFKDTYEFVWCGHQIKLQHFYGHSADGLITVIDDRIVFSGDTLLSIPTVTRLPSGSTARFWEEDIVRLRELDGEMLVYPGHGEPGRLKDMLIVNKMPERYRKR